MAELQTPAGHAAFTPSGLRMRAATALPGAPWRDGSPGHPLHAGLHPGPSDFDLNPDLSGSEAWAHSLATARPATVLIPAIARPEITLLFTQRTAHLTAHAGQIAFPGGKAEPVDANPLATALREAHEEIGLEADRVEPLGALDVYLTGTGYRITPIVALVDASAAFHLDPNEVAEIFEVPLAFLMDPANHQRHTRTIGGRDRTFYAIPFGERFIWGATAGILRNMHERLFAP